RFPKLWLSLSINLGLFAHSQVRPEMAGWRTRGAINIRTSAHILLFAILSVDHSERHSSAPEPSTTRILIRPAVALLTAALAFAGASNSLMNITPNKARLFIANADNSAAIVVNRPER